MNNINAGENDCLPKFLVQLIDGFSAQAKVTARFWLALALVSILTVMPGTDKVQIQFLSISISRVEFYPFAALLSSILIIGFGSAYIKMIGTRELIDRVLSDIENQLKLAGNIHPKDAFDCIVSPNINQIAPIAQSLLGEFQYFPEKAKCPPFRKCISTIYYSLLKFAAILITFVFPGYALIKSIAIGGSGSWRGFSWGIPVPIFWFVNLISFTILIQLLLGDINYWWRALKRIKSPRAGAGR